ncbi:MAG TPA: UDP-N-acetylmuramoyl-L-alanine--D-glutamate ligase [Thermoanaerobacterales bacterium]|uniref:UDP-N-acetylmuramoyl-L-alanine--D-glutamate ligase n=1 Tax=Tepidanaerobacter sp. GT38 TaxID=2722793 RepID=UPI00178D521B|nr:UDP-N-acetylmuramoyl-L-alanine--D-glutamate ligase [Tepidanaerobacter sp. GT38]HHY42375.1 UDP-N-acetylmuramoyl-L-alanine--D-glutamate ligase [Thermoanaerobacterales bacterium]
MELKGKNVLILGLARSGVAAAEELTNLGAKVTASDLKAREKLKDADSLESMGVKLVLGEHPVELLNGCDLVVLSPGVPSDLEIFYEARKRDIPIISELELGFWFAKAPIIAVTGTNGKTTTTTLIGEILKNDGKNITLAGNIGIPLIREVEKADSKDYLVVEVSSFQLENIMHFKPKISVILNITEDHLNRHKTFENYIEAKARIFENQTEEDYTVLNYDDPVVKSFVKRIKAKIIFFSQKEELPRGIYVKNGVIVIRENGKMYPLLKADELGIKGTHNLENALAAASVAWICRTNLNNMAETLKHFHGVEHRLEFVTEIGKVKFFNDSKATNPDSAKKSIEALKEPIVLIAGGYDKKSDFTSFVKAFNGRVKKLILIGDTADIIEETAKKHGFNNVEKTSSLQQAVRLAFDAAKPGDAVLLSPACASWDMFENFEERGRIFKETVFSLKD